MRMLNERNISQVTCSSCISDFSILFAKTKVDLAFIQEALIQMFFQCIHFYLLKVATFDLRS